MKNLFKGEEGFSSIGNVYYRYYLRNKEAPLVVTFSYLGANSKRESAENGTHFPWGYEFIVSQGLNALSFCCIGGNNWYTDREFQGEVENIGKEIEKTGLKVLGYGGSMGGFGVSAFANPLRIEKMLLLNPISTLNSSKAPFEYRFNNARKNLDWNCLYNDGADADALGYVVYDPFFKVDALHAERYSHLEKLKFPGVGHSIPNHLARIRALKWVFSSFLEGSIDKQRFNELLRRKRNYRHYYNWMLSDENSYLTKNRREVVERYFNAYMLLNGETGIPESKDVNFIRDLALNYEKEDLAVSYQLMAMAEKFRPRGPFIKRKLKEYKKRLSQVDVQS